MMLYNRAVIRVLYDGSDRALPVQQEIGSGRDLRGVT